MLVSQQLFAFFKACCSIGHAHALLTNIRPGASSTKRYRFVMYGFCSKLMCLYKLVCLSLTIEKTLAFYKIYPFFENYESRMFYSTGPFIINYTPDLQLYQNKLVHFGIMHTMNGTTYFAKAISYARKMFMKQTTTCKRLVSDKTRQLIVVPTSAVTKKKKFYTIGTWFHQDVHKVELNFYKYICKKYYNYKRTLALLKLIQTSDFNDQFQIRLVHFIKVKK